MTQVWYIEADGCYPRSIEATSREQAIKQYQRSVKYRTDGQYVPPVSTMRITPIEAVGASRFSYGTPNIIKAVIERN